MKHEANPSFHGDESPRREFSTTERIRLEPKLPKVVLVGRRNVGKSTLFNALFGANRAITRDEPGVTVDSFYEIVWRGQRPFLLGDMPGLDLSTEDSLSRKSRELAIKELNKAAAIIFLLEYPELTPQDHELFNLVRKSKRPVIAVLNKVDNPQQDLDTEPYYSLGLAEEPLCVSAKGRSNIRHIWEKIEHTIYADDQRREMVDGLLATMQADDAADPHLAEGGSVGPEQSLTEGQLEMSSYPMVDGQPSNLGAKPSVSPEPAPIKLALVGRPNCGKSSLLNRILGWERAVVTDTAGTTRDKTDTPFRFRFPDGRFTDLLLLDTAGIRRKVKQSAGTEYYSFKRSQRAMEEAHVILHVIDVSEPERISKADKQLSETIAQLGKPAVMVFNKWDLFDLEGRTFPEFLDAIYHAFPAARQMEVITASAVTGQRVPQLIVKAVELYERAAYRPATAELNDWFQEALRRSPKGAGMSNIRIKYAVQVQNFPVRIRLFVKNPAGFPDNLLRYFENKLRKAMNWQSVPIFLEVAETDAPKKSKRS